MPRSTRYSMQAYMYVLGRPYDFRHGIGIHTVTGVDDANVVEPSPGSTTAGSSAGSFAARASSSCSHLRRFAELYPRFGWGLTGGIMSFRIEYSRETRSKYHTSASNRM